MLSFLFYCSSTGDLVSVNTIESLAKRKRMDKEARLATVQVKESHFLICYFTSLLTTILCVIAGWSRGS